MTKFTYPETDAQVAANEWEAISAARAADLLGCVPPARQRPTAFAVGEPLNHMADGSVVVCCVVRVRGKYYTKPYPLKRFDPALFVREVKAQLKEAARASSS